MKMHFLLICSKF